LSDRNWQTSVLNIAGIRQSSHEGGGFATAIGGVRLSMPTSMHVIRPDRDFSC